MLLETMAEKLEAVHLFAVAYMSWTNGTVQHMIREVGKLSRTVLNKRRCSVREGPLIVTAVQWGLNAAFW